MSRLVSSASVDRPTLSKMAQVYAIWAFGGLLLYLVLPMVSYLIFWDALPKLRLTPLFSGWLFPTIYLRLLLLSSGQLHLRTRYLALGYLLLVWISALQLIWLPTISAQVGQDAFFATAAFTFVGAWGVFLGGEALAIFALKKPRLVRTALFIAYLILVLVVVDGVGNAYRFYGKLFFAFQDPVSGEIYNYLSLADSLAIVGLLLLGSAEAGTLWRSFVLYAGTSLVLLFAYSRTSFFCFLISGLVFMTVKFWQQAKKRLLLAVLGFAAAILIIALLWSSQMEKRGGLFIEQIDPTLERVSSLVSGTDLSLQSRWELFREGLNLIERHWLLGYFMGEVVELDRGAYVHNWLSFWLAYGIGPFTLSIWLLCVLLIRNWRQRKSALLALAGVSLLVFTLLAIALARSYIWPYFWFSLGFVGTLSSPSQRRDRPC